MPQSELKISISSLREYIYKKRAFRVSPGEPSLENLAHARVVSGQVTHLVFYKFTNLYFEEKQQPNEGSVPLLSSLPRDSGECSPHDVSFGLREGRRRKKRQILNIFTWHLTSQPGWFVGSKHFLQSEHCSECPDAVTWSQWTNINCCFGFMYFYVLLLHPTSITWIW